MNPQLIWIAVTAGTVLAVLGLVAAGVRRTRPAAIEVPPPLTTGERTLYRGMWKQIETRFTEHPDAAVLEAKGLIAFILRRIDDPALHRFRDAHASMRMYARVSSSELGQAMLRFRATFEELVGFGRLDVAREIVTEREVVGASVSSEQPLRAAAALPSPLPDTSR
jgi:hypothetical protein